MYLVCDSLPVGQDTALQEATQLALHEAWHAAIMPACPIEERLQRLRDGLMQNRLLGAARRVGLPFRSTA